VLGVVLRLERFGLYFLFVEHFKIALRQLLCVKPMHRALNTTKAAFGLDLNGGKTLDLA